MLASAMLPTPMRVAPTVRLLMPANSKLSTKARIAPTAMRIRITAAVVTKFLSERFSAWMPTSLCFSWEQKIAAAARSSRQPRGRFGLLKDRAAILLFFGGGITSALLA
jgi:hypothetical protein